ncbi:MAG: hypothetical protein Ta2A_15870 [Treponemataceae bacterium]|nr:MAG: hypothetical protein Ta2A_15870 [Treponemataceae bacterium]
MQNAQKLSHAADVFYNKGRAVAWFNQVLYPLKKPLKMKPSVFFEGFENFLDSRSDFHSGSDADSVKIEKLQLAYLDALYTKAKKQRLLDAVHDIVRFGGAWARALVDGITTNIAFNYDPDAVLGGMDIENFVASTKKALHPIQTQVQPGKDEPQLVLR